jgi:hypothetical protein
LGRGGRTPDPAPAQNPISHRQQGWITTMHDATARVLTDNETFTMRNEDGARVRRYGA